MAGHQSDGGRYALNGKRVWVAGHRGMVGAALARRLAREDCEVVTAARGEVDLTSQAAVARWMEANRPEAVIVAAAKVGGILANDTYPAEFLWQNLMIEANIIDAAYPLRRGEAALSRLLVHLSPGCAPAHSARARC